MIQLTTPIQIPNQLGGGTHLSYDKMRIVEILADPLSQTVTATVQLMVSTNANAPIIPGTLTISTATGTNQLITVVVNSLSFYAGVALNAGAVTTVQGWITGLQNNIESGLISEAIVAGTQSAGV